MLYQLSVILILALLLLAVMRRVALAIGLVDKPNARKQHCGRIPLAGGIALYLTVTLFTLWQPAWLPHSEAYLLCISVLVAMGAVDDAFDLPVIPRICVQGAIALVMMLAAGLRLHTLGYLGGNEEWQLGGLSLWVTPLAVWGAINAFNMIDGIDGQLAVLSSIAFAGLALLFTQGQKTGLTLGCLGMIAALTAFLLFNLGILGATNKIFMGDAGSMMIGLTVLWLSLVATQESRAVARPITVLWLIAIPLMDMVRVSLCRLLRRQSPFSAGRDHLHHILMRRGLNSLQALGMSSLLAMLMAAVGVISEMLLLPESLMLLAFLLCFSTYFALMREPRQNLAYTEQHSVDR